MSEITVSESKDYFIKDGMPFFYLADKVNGGITCITGRYRALMLSR